MGLYFGNIQQGAGGGEVLPVSGVTGWYGKLVNSGVTRTSLSSGTTITQWDDQSGNGYHMGDYLGTPYYDATENAIRLNSASTIGCLGNAPPIGGSVSTTFVVYKNMGSLTENERTYPINWGSSTPWNIVCIEDVGTPFTYLGAGAAYKDWAATIFGTAKVLTTYHNSTNNSTGFFLKKNGSLVTHRNLTPNTIPNNERYLAICGGIDAGGSLVLYGSAKNWNVYEVIIYAASLGAQQIIDTENWLNAKYSIY